MVADRSPPLWKTTEIYLQAIGQERRNLVMQAWDSLD